jgi:hypothetical protein
MDAPIYTVNYYKVSDRWYLDYSPHLEAGGDPEALERIGFFREFLDHVARGDSSVVFIMSTEPFEDADVMILTGGSGDNTGGYYFIERFNNVALGYELWMNTILYHEQRELPQKIYIKRVG